MTIREPSPSLPIMKHFDCIIIGSGIAGASVAAHLAATKKVLMIEMEERPGYHTTGRSAARYEPHYGPSAFVAFSKASGAFYRDPPAGFTDVPLLSERPCLVIAPDIQREETIHFLSADDSVAVLSEQEALGLMPVLRKGIAERFFLDTQSGDLDVDLVHRGYLRLFKARGGESVMNAEAISLQQVQGLWQIETKAGYFSCETVVNAAGAWGDVIAERAGLRAIGLIPKRRSIGVAPVDHPGLMSWPMLTDAGETFYIKPQSGKLLVSSADATPVDPHDAYADDEAIATGIDRLMQVTTLEINRIEHSWGGLRTFTPDKNPAIGFDPNNGGFFWLVGQGGYGIQSAPAISETAAAMILGQAIPDYVLANGLNPSQIKPNRFLS
jgi:D-arginine dehydrogenase